MEERLSRVSRRASEEKADRLKLQVDAFPKRDHVAWRVNPRPFRDSSRHEPFKPVLEGGGGTAALTGYRCSLFSATMSDAEI